MEFLLIPWRIRFGFESFARYYPCPSLPSQHVLCGLLCLTRAALLADLATCGGVGGRYRVSVEGQGTRVAPKKMKVSILMRAVQNLIEDTEKVPKYFLGVFRHREVLPQAAFPF